MELSASRKPSVIQRVIKSSSGLEVSNDPAGDQGLRLSATASLSRQIEIVRSQQLNSASKESRVIFPDSGESASEAKLACTTKLFVGSGHILNDLCASLWYSYLLLYFQNIVGFTSKQAGALLLLGQIVDGVATPLVGYAEDSVHNCWLCKKNYGRFKSWHLIGCILVCCTFPFIFTECLGCADEVYWIKMIYYSPFIAVFQVGWATIQISHLALIPKVSLDESIRTELIAIRYGFTVCANVSIFIMTSFILGFSSECKISKSDAPKFRNIALLAVGIGIVFSMLFHLIVKEKSDANVIRSTLNTVSALRVSSPLSFHSNAKEIKQLEEVNKEKSIAAQSNTIGSNKQTEEEISNVQPTEVLLPVENSGNQDPSTEVNQRPKIHKIMTIKDWMKTAQFYNVAVIYTFTRLAINLTQCYMPLYLQDSLMLPCSTVATVPLTMYLSGLVVSFFIKFVSTKIGRMFSYLIGLIFSVIGAFCILYLDWSHRGFLHDIGIYIVAALLGGGASALLVISLAITADLIGANIENGAFVYGSMSFSDKICCGLVIMLINSLAPCPNHSEKALCVEKINFYRNVVGYSCGVFSLVGFLAVLLRSYYLNLERNKRK